MQILCYPNDGLSALSIDSCIVITVVEHGQPFPELPVNNGALKLRFKKNTDWLDQDQLFAIKDYYVKKRELGHSVLVLGTPHSGTRNTLLMLLEKL